MTAIGVFGGTFDPIHIGHLAAAEDARADLSLDEILFVPNASPPHKQGRPVSPATDRAAMVDLAVRGNPAFRVSRVEIDRGGLSYTLDTLRQLRATLPDATRLTFLTGWDALAQLHTWHEPDSILREFTVALIDRPLAGPVPWDLVEARFPNIRSQVRVVEVPRLEISAEEIRLRVRCGLPIRYYVPDAVREYIDARGLYRPAP